MNFDPSLTFEHDLVGTEWTTMPNV